MGLLPDWQIKRDVKIVPFAEEASRPGVVSFGVSSYGYDVRVGRKFKVFTNVYGGADRSEKLQFERLCRHRRRLLHHSTQ